MQITLIVLYVLFWVCEAQKDGDLYKTLGIAKTASQQDVKKAFRALSQKYHPDRNQEDPKANERFAKINNAYEALSDPEKRKKYDKYGEEGLKDQLSQDNDMFGFFGGGNRQRGEQKGPNLQVKIRVTLEDIYNGKEVPVYLTKQVLCPHCRGSGADDPDDVQTCPKCNGVGSTIKRQQVAMGFFQQYQATCDTCNGKGKIYKSKCHICKGNKIIPGSEELGVYIEKGILDGHKMTYQNAADERESMLTSDLVFQIVQAPHPYFKREGNDLRISVWITLKEALLGFKKKIKHLDNRFVKIEKDTVTQPGDIQRIKGEGMPQHEFSSQHGDLFVEFHIKIPEFNKAQIKLWEKFFN